MNYQKAAGPQESENDWFFEPTNTTKISKFWNG